MENQNEEEQSVTLQGCIGPLYIHVESSHDESRREREITDYRQMQYNTGIFITDLKL